MNFFNKKEPIGIIEYHKKTLVKFTTILMFLYAPLVILVIFSFNDSKRNLVWKGFTFKYYEKFFANDFLIEAFINSLVIASISTFISIILGVASAYSLWRFKFPFRNSYEAVLTLPMVVPEICMGATNLQIIRDVLLSFLKPAIVSGAIMAFTLSLDDFVITFFTATPDITTFPLKVYSMVKFYVTPEVNAASTILIVITLILVCWLFGYQKISEQKIKNKI